MSRLWLPICLSPVLVLSPNVSGDIFAFAGIEIGGSDNGVGNPLEDTRATDLIVLEYFQEPFENDFIIGIKWDLRYTAFGAPPLGTPSWGSELRIDLIAPNGNRIDFDGSNDNGGGMGLGEDADGQVPGGGAFPGIDPNKIIFGWGNAPGGFNSAGVTHNLDGSLSGGLWTILIWDEFDDAGGVDGVLSGSFTIQKIPAPGSLALFILGGLIARRGRR